MLEEGVGDHGHQDVAVKPPPRPSLEMVEPEFFLHLLMGLFANPARLDGRNEELEIGIGGKIGKVVFLMVWTAPALRHRGAIRWS
jgi:hypothetical protein